MPDASLRTGFTGTRQGMTSAQSRAVWEVLCGLTGWLHHGDCVGADEEAHRMARIAGLRVEGHPPLNHALRAWCACNVERKPAPYIARNHAIVRATSSLIAAPATVEELSRSGTWATVRYARHLRRPVRIILPNGDVRIEQFGMPAPDSPPLP